MLQHLHPAILGVVLFTLLTGCVFPLALFAVGHTLFRDAAAGSLVTRGGIVVGSRLIGQNFSRKEYFHPRPSAAGTGYDGTSSVGTQSGHFVFIDPGSSTWPQVVKAIRPARPRTSR